MVTDIPSPELFAAYGKDYLNLSWTNSISVILDFEDAEPWDGLKGEDEREDYYASARHELTTAISLAEQGAEFLLKSRIAEVSPWLLISQSPQDWPRRCNTEDIPFSRFRTVDAQDLIKIHDTMCATRLSESFREFFERIRTERNSIIHTVDETISVSISRVLGYVLEVVEHLVGQHQWLAVRREYLENERHSLVYPLYSNAQIVREMAQVVDVLDPSKLIKYFGFDKKQRRYICPSCAREDESGITEPRTAQLFPNEPTGINVRCFVCEEDFEVERVDCEGADCKGNVIYEGECLTCRKTQA